MQRSPPTDTSGFRAATGRRIRTRRFVPTRSSATPDCRSPDRHRSSVSPRIRSNRIATSTHLGDRSQRGCRAGLSITPVAHDPQDWNRNAREQGVQRWPALLLVAAAKHRAVHHVAVRVDHLRVPSAAREDTRRHATPARFTTRRLVLRRWRTRVAPVHARRVRPPTPAIAARPTRLDGGDPPLRRDVAGRNHHRPQPERSHHRQGPPAAALPATARRAQRPRQRALPASPRAATGEQRNRALSVAVVACRVSSYSTPTSPPPGAGQA